jgi:hypothetical protein
MAKSKVNGIKGRRQRALERLNVSIDKYESICKSDELFMVGISEHIKKKFKVRLDKALKVVENLEAKKNYRRKNK